MGKENKIDNLVIVESPAKAKTIEKFLGKNFQVTSSFGHIRDLEKKNLGIEVKNGYNPQYIVPVEKKKVVTDLKKLVKDSGTIWLASDEDREGEAIAWHLAEVLDLDINDTKRIVFHEITKDAILNAIKTPRTIDINLVNAQQARRILDRLVGFEISPVLWRKVKPQLSAGRVQSVAVRLIVEREREIHAFVSESSFKVVAKFTVTDNNGKVVSFNAELPEKINKKEDVLNFLERCKNNVFTVKNIVTKPLTKSPAPPFTTSTLQQEASRKLGFSVSQTMTVAQKLYENGFITYMRTDSVNLSDAAIDGAKKAIETLIGPEYSKPRNYKTKTKGAQEAHEAIRPSYMDRSTIEGNINEQKLYSLIWKRTIASQMKEALFEKTVVNISIKGLEEEFVATGEVLKFDGFLNVYLESVDDDQENEEQKGLLPPLNVKQVLDLNQIEATERFTHYPPRYTEASLVRKLEELGIGRPSTYAPIISTIQQRGYVEKTSRDGVKRNYCQLILKNELIKEQLKSEITGTEKFKLFPTDIGIVVNDFLIKHFTKIVNFDFTANVEKEFDEIASGKIVWNKMIDKFYKPFHETVESTIEKSERGDGERFIGKDPATGKPIIARIGKFGPLVQLGETSKDQADKEKPKYARLKKDQLLETITLDEALELLKHSNEGRKLGTDPETGKPVIARIGRFGPIVQIGDINDEKLKYAGLKPGQDIESITLESALELFALPRTIGEFEGKNIVASVGRFGPYLAHNSKFISLKKGVDDPYTVDLERAITLIRQKREADQKKIIKEFPENPDLLIIKDRWGKPCLFYNKTYIRLSTKLNPESLSYEDCFKMVEEIVPPKKTQAVAKKTTAKKATATKSTTRTTSTTKKTTAKTTKKPSKKE